MVGVMPLQKDFVTAGRYELKRVVERWGGSAELAAVAGYQARPSDISPISEHHIDCCGNSIMPQHCWMRCCACTLAEPSSLAQMRGPGGEEWRQHVAECAAETGLGGKQVDPALSPNAVLNPDALAASMRFNQHSAASS